MVDEVFESIKKDFPDFVVKNNVDLEIDNKKGTISASQGARKGFDINFDLESGSISIGFASKIRSYVMFATLGLTVLLVLLFGGSMLSAFGLVSAGGRTLKILYIIPTLIFLIPTMIISMRISKKLNPVDHALLERVKKSINALGHEAIIEE